MCNQKCSHLYWKDAAHSYAPRHCPNDCDKKKQGHKVHKCRAHIRK